MTCLCGCLEYICLYSGIEKQCYMYFVFLPWFLFVNLCTRIAFNFINRTKYILKICENIF